jgi:hypothetical protein
VHKFNVMVFLHMCGSILQTDVCLPAHLVRDLVDSGMNVDISAGPARPQFS